MAIFPSGQKTVLASASHRQSEIAYIRAEKLRLRFKEKPLAARTREDYEYVLDAYRSVYHGDPASPDAGRSIAAVADLLAEEGRTFRKEKFFHDAVAQWEFLRREYPGSPLRQRALFQEAQIEQHDLHDRVTAKKMYRSFLSLYPHDSLAEQARAEMEGQTKSYDAATSLPATADRLRKAQGSTSISKAQHDTKPIEKPGAFSGSPDATNTNIAVVPRQPSAVQADGTVPTIQAVRYWAEGDSTRLAVDMDGDVPYHAYLASDGKQITLIFFGAHLSESLAGRSTPVMHDANLRSFHAYTLTGNQVELVLLLTHATSFSSFTLSNPDRLILNIQKVSSGSDNRAAPQIADVKPDSSKVISPQRSKKIPVSHHVDSARVQSTALLSSVAPSTKIVVDNDVKSTTPPLSAAATVDGQHSMTRVLGLRIRRIVIDAGHGGYDSGTLGPGGIEEKDVALDVALRLGHLLRQRLGAEVIYTRQSDKFISLEDRTAIANRAHADLFISIHANSSSDPDVRGVETYFLNFTASSDALQVAARENATSNRSVHELSDLVRKITLSDKIDESKEFAADVQQSLYNGLASDNAGLKNRGVKQAPFMVLIGANMPSILAEISFLTNPQDAEELAQPAYRERLAESLYRGVVQYVDGMSGVRVAKTNQPQPPIDPAESSAE